MVTRRPDRQSGPKPGGLPVSAAMIQVVTHALILAELKLAPHNETPPRLATGGPGHA